MKVSNHVQFVDDTIMLGGASITIAWRFNLVMSTFVKATNGKIYSAKSKVYGWNCTLETLVNIARALVFERNANWNSFNYLGIPIFKGKKGLLTGKG